MLSFFAPAEWPYTLADPDTAAEPTRSEAAHKVTTATPTAEEMDTFVEKVRNEAYEGVQHFADLPHHAGSTKTALALTCLAYECGRRDGLKPQGNEKAALTKDLCWAKFQLAKDELEGPSESREVKKLRVDLRWTKFQMAKREQTKDEEIKKLRAELEGTRQAQNQKESKLPEANGQQNGDGKMVEKSDHAIAAHNYDIRQLTKKLEYERSEKEKYENLLEEASRKLMSHGQKTSDEFEGKISVLQKAIDTIEQQFKQQNDELHSKLEKSEQGAQKAKDKHSKELRQVQKELAEKNAILCAMYAKTFPGQEAGNHKKEADGKIRTLQAAAKKTGVHDEGIERLKRENSAYKMKMDSLGGEIISLMMDEDKRDVKYSSLLEEKERRIEELQKNQHPASNKLKEENAHLRDRIRFLIDEKELQYQEYLQNLMRMRSANSGQGQNDAASSSQSGKSGYVESIRALELKLMVLEDKAINTEQGLKANIQKLEKELVRFGPLNRFIQDRDFSDTERSNLTWTEMTYAVRAAAVGLSPQIRRFLAPGYSAYLVEETLRHGSTDLVTFSQLSPDRFDLQYQFFEAVETIVDNILWETQKFQKVRQQLSNDSKIVKAQLQVHKRK